MRNLPPLSEQIGSFQITLVLTVISSLTISPGQKLHVGGSVSKRINKQTVNHILFFYQMSHSLNGFIALEVKKMHIDARNAGHNGIYIEFVP